MRLFPDEHRQLDAIDGTLRADAPVLAAKFEVFARLARSEGEPPAERRFRIARRRHRIFTWLRRRIRILRLSRPRRSVGAGLPR